MNIPKRDILFCWLALAAYLLVVLRSAWLTEDAYITFRTVDHFINGFGLRWNIAERVQTYTNPLWMLLVSSCYLFTGEIFYTAIALSVAVSLLAVALFVRQLAASLPAALLGTAILCCSKSFIDYSTSGLENPLNHLLLAIFAWLYLGRIQLANKLWPLSLLAALAACNRMDTALLYAPALLYAFWPRRNLRTGLTLLAGFTPLALWIGFSLVYYGFPFPTTAYFKLGGGIPAGELARHGLYYLRDSLYNDPLTLSTIAAAVAAICWQRHWRPGALVFGAVLYLLYVIKIGGDFYSGRFISLPLFAAIIAAAALPQPTTRYWPAALVCILALSTAIPGSPLLSGSDYGKTGPEESYINDERGQFYQAAGLLPTLRRDPPSGDPEHWWVERAQRLRQGDATLTQDLPHSPTRSVRIQDPHLIRRRANGHTLTTWGNIGYSGFFAGPDVHILDALADPLLARLPARQDLNWRPGHFSRIVPTGYIETLLENRNALADSNLAALYDALHLITQGPLFTTDRWTEIWKVNTGQYNQLIDREAFLHPSALAIARSDLHLRPGDPLKNYALGKAYLDAGQTAPGIAAFDSAFAKSSGSHNIRQLAGAALYGHGLYAFAAEAYRQAVDLQPDRYDYHAGLGAALKAEGQLAEALRAYANAARLHDQDPIVYYGLGMVAMELGHTKAAINALRRTLVLAEKADVNVPHTEVGIALFELGDTAASSRAYVLALAKNPNDLSARTNLGWNYYAAGELDSAVVQYEEVLRQEANSIAHFNLGLALLARGDIDRARAVYQQALSTYGAAEGHRIGAAEDLRNLLERGEQMREAR